MRIFEEAGRGGVYMDWVEGRNCTLLTELNQLGK